MSDPTINAVHGHDVMHLMAEAGKPLTFEQLEKETAAAFGPDARYHTCSAEGMTLEQLVSFLLARGKIRQTAEGLEFAGGMCQH